MTAATTDKALPIYLDYMATTPLDPAVLEEMQKSCWSGPTSAGLGNANALHSYGERSRALVETARARLAELISGKPEGVIWTSGATESNNLAIQGVARFYRRSGGHLITSLIEHASVLKTFQALERSGFTVSYLKPDKQGFISPQELKKILCKNTILVSIGGANGEFGTIEPLAELAEAAHQVGAIFHSDMAQMLGKIPIDITALNVDLATFSAHKIYGPQGIGALYIHNVHKRHLTPICFGGAQEQGIRPGSLPVALIVGMGKACDLLRQNGAVEQARMQTLGDKFYKALTESPYSSRIKINGGKPRLPNLVNLTLEGLDRERGLLEMLPQLAIAYSSACHWDCRSSKLPLSNALLEIGVPENLLQHSARISWGRYTTEEELMTTASCINELLANTDKSHDR